MKPPKELERAIITGAAASLLHDRAEHELAAMRAGFGMIGLADHVITPEGYHHAPQGLGIFIDTGGESVDQQEREAYQEEIKRLKHHIADLLGLGTATEGVKLPDVAQLRDALLRDPEFIKAIISRMTVTVKSES